MIFRSRADRGRRTGLLRRGASEGKDSRAIGRLSREIEDLSRAYRDNRDPELARRILQLRHAAGLKLLESPASAAEFAAPDFDQLPSDAGLIEVAADDLTPGLLRAAILQSGCLLIRGLIDEDEVARLVAGIDRAYEARDAYSPDESAASDYFEPFVPDPRFDLAFDRAIVGSGGAAGLWAVDSPPVMLDVMDAFERSGLQRLAAEYLDEHPAISVNKCLVRKVSPTVFEASEREKGQNLSAWHQDGAFMGGVRALNVWLSLSRCGDVAPGMDIVPSRIDHVVETGSEGAVFEWSVSQAVAEEVAGDVGVLRPIFEPGDVLLFDELFLHATAAEPGMPAMRYAVECWFFGPSGFPTDYAPLAV